MTAFTMRPAILGDADAAAEVWLRSRHAAGEHIPAPVHTDAEVCRWISSHVLADLECWVAETRTGQLVGLLVLDQDRLEQLYVLPAWQGRGVGDALVDLAKRLRPGGLQLRTFVSNAPARRFYERRGFVCVEETDGQDNEERAPDMRYVYRPESRDPLQAAT